MKESRSAAFESMDRMYRFQRYFYDLTRKYYLLGRDRLLTEMNIQCGQTVLEIGCGTGRNLAILAKRHNEATFFGLDASMAMLKVADARTNRLHLKNIALVNALADDFYHDVTFGLSECFDKMFFSYSISMIPDWQAAIDNALDNLKPGGGLFIVDFLDQKDLPPWLRTVLTNWLKLFHVRFPTELLPYLKTLEQAGLGSLTVTPLFRRYSFIARFTKL